jgi:hypothetical protein
MPTSLQKRIVGKAAAYSPSFATDRSGTVITTRDGAGALTFTLPTPARAYLGFEFEFVNVRDQNMTVQGTTAGDLLTFNNAAASSVAASTAGQKIGARIRAICVEVTSGVFKWCTTGISVGHTFTVA